MKILSELIMLTLTAQVASALELPIGEFNYSKTQAISTKHFHRLYPRSPREKSMVEDYRARGYLCKRQNSSITDCSKTIETNPNNFEFKTEKLALLSPSFDEQIKNINELSSGESVTIYEVEQGNALNSTKNSTYKVYDVTGGGFYLDLKANAFKTVRFEMISPEVMTRFSYEKEKLGKREHYRHSLTSYYIK